MVKCYVVKYAVPKRFSAGCLCVLDIVDTDTDEEPAVNQETPHEMDLNLTDETTETHSDQTESTSLQEPQPPTGNSQVSMADEVIFYCKLIVCVTGCFGNILSMLVIQYTKIPLTARITISILAVSDLFYLLQHAPAIIFPKFYKMSFFDYTNTTCQFATFSGLFFAFVSSLMVTTLTIIRVIAVVKPLHSNLFLSAKKLLVGLSFVIIADLVGYAYVSSLYTVADVLDGNNTIILASCHTKELRNVIQFCGVFINLVIPLLITVMGNIVIITTVLWKRKNIAGMISGGSYQAGDLRLVITTVSISSFFILLTSPLALYYTVGEKILGTEVFINWTNLYFLSCETLYYTNFGINFFLYVAFTKSFRDALKVLSQKCTGRGTSEQMDLNETRVSAPHTVSSRVSSASQVQEQDA